jgi:hypothetical protein
MGCKDTVTSDAGDDWGNKCDWHARFCVVSDAMDNVQQNDARSLSFHSAGCSWLLDLLQGILIHVRLRVVLRGLGVEEVLVRVGVTRRRKARWYPS